MENLILSNFPILFFFFLPHWNMKAWFEHFRLNNNKLFRRKIFIRSFNFDKKSLFLQQINSKQLCFKKISLFNSVTKQKSHHKPSSY